MLGNILLEAEPAELQNAPAFLAFGREGAHKTHDDAPGAVILAAKFFGSCLLAQQLERVVRTGQIHLIARKADHKGHLFLAGHNVGVHAVGYVVVHQHAVKPCVKADILPKMKVANRIHRNRVAHAFSPHLMHSVPCRAKPRERKRSKNVVPLPRKCTASGKPLTVTVSPSSSCCPSCPSTVR